MEPLNHCVYHTCKCDGSDSLPFPPNIARRHDCHHRHPLASPRPRLTAAPTPLWPRATWASPIIELDQVTSPAPARPGPQAQVPTDVAPTIAPTPAITLAPALQGLEAPASTDDRLLYDDKSSQTSVPPTFLDSTRTLLLE